MNKQIEGLVNNIERVIIGKRDTIVLVITAMLTNGHVLIEDVPGVGKTQLVSALARSVDGKFNRIQLTPDIMPSDIMGYSMINPTNGELEYRTGAAFCNFLLADEINRASSKAQSSLLEIMEEFQVSVDGSTYPLPIPFMTLATQNPVETFGTYHLPEAQMDRFIMRLSMGYPDFNEEISILSRDAGVNKAKEIDAVMSLEEVVKLRMEATKVFVHEKLKEYILNIVTATRNSEAITLGVSPRGSISLYNASKSLAFIDGRDYVTPEDIKRLAVPVLAHRIILSSKGRASYASKDECIKDILSGISVPVTQ